MAGGLFQAKLDFSDPNGTIDLTKRGFTDHEHLDEVQLIHMNGRMFDYNNGRFLSVDPFIQAPTSTQSLNPYTYIFNNPLSGVDPTGYLVECDKPDCADLDVSKIDKLSIDKDGNLTATFSDGSTDTITAEAAGAVAADIITSNGVGTIADKNILAGAFTGAISALGANPAATGQQLYNAALESARKLGGRFSGKAAGKAARIAGGVVGIVASIIFGSSVVNNEEEANQSATKLVMHAIMESRKKGKGGITRARQDGSGGTRQTPPNGDDDDKQKIVFQTDSAAKKQAEKMGYREINTRTRHGTKIFKKGKSYITRDRTGHNGGAWKEARTAEGLNTKQTRLGTFNKNMSKRVGD